jgi:hypothetical protein
MNFGHEIGDRRQAALGRSRWKSARWRRVALAVCISGGIVFGACAWVSTSIGAVDPLGPAVASTRQGEKFPLWTVLTVKSFAVLGEGQTGRNQWGAYIFRGPQAPATEPCIVVPTYYTGPTDQSAGSLETGEVRCGPLTPASRRIVIARSGIAIKPSLKSPYVTLAALAMTFSPEVRQVTIHFGSGPSETRPTRLLSARQTAKARVRPLRYVAFGLAHSACVTGVTGFDADGVQLFDAPAERCR